MFKFKKKKKAAPDELKAADQESQEGVLASRPSTDTNIVLQLLVGLIGLLIATYGTYPLKGTKMDYYYAVINQRGPVQYFEVYMFFMCGMVIYQKTKIIRNQLRVIAENPVSADIDLNDDEQISLMRKTISQREDFSYSIVLNRIDRLLSLWLATKDVGRVSGYLSSESGRDTSAADSSYTNARVLLWAIPIMGFIGTVLGLGQALDGFSKFLSSAAELSEIKNALAGVTSGLGVAFDTTLLALVLSVFLMFPLSSIQRKEENFFVEIDNFIDDVLVTRLPSAGQAPIVIENLEDSIEAAFRRYIPDPDRYDEVFTRSIEKAATAVEERFSGLAQNYEATLRDLTGRLSASMATVGESMQSTMHGVMKEILAQDQALMTSRKQIAQEETERLKDLMQDVQSSALKFYGDYQKSAEALQTTTRESVEKTLVAARDLGKRMSEVAAMAASIEELLRIEQSVQKGLEGLAAADEFRKMLSGLRDHLATTDAFCDRMSRPRIITLQEELA